MGHRQAGVVKDDLTALFGEGANAKWIDAIVKAARQAGPMFERVVASTATDGKLLYAVHGIDALPKAGGGAMLIESNIFPSMGIESSAGIVTGSRVAKNPDGSVGAPLAVWGLERGR